MDDSRLDARVDVTEQPVPALRELSDRERAVILLLAGASGGRAEEWEANLRDARVETGHPSTALSLVYPSAGVMDPWMRILLPVRALVCSPHDAWIDEIVAWSDGAYLSQVEHLWYTDDVPREWPAVEDPRVVPRVPLQRL